MLILKRRIGQSFLIDGRILVKLMSTARGSAVIGIQAPVAVPVLREEVLERQEDLRLSIEAMNKAREERATP